MRNLNNLLCTFGIRLMRDRGMAYIYSASGLVGLADDVQGMFASVNECVCVK